MTNSIEITPFRAFYMTAGTTILLIGVFVVGIHWGKSSILEAERLKAQNEVTHQIVRVGDQPNAVVTDLARTACIGDNDYDKCISTFLEPFAPSYVVNLVDGTYTQIVPRTEP